MFESDDFDQVLSQFDFGDVIATGNIEKENKVCNSNNTVINTKIIIKNNDSKPSSATVVSDKIADSQKYEKRKIINSHFDHKSKRKFPGPAGLLTGNLEEFKDESICQVELLSQDIDFTQNNHRRDLFQSPLWLTLLDNIKSWNLVDIDFINAVKQQAMTGNLRRRKANMVAAFVETVDRSDTDPLIMLRDTTGTIKCTLHRDAWFKFAPYIVAEYCALVLWRPTVLTTGSAFKKHYLNITLSNILAIYSSALLSDQENELPEEYSIVCKDDFTVIKANIDPVSNSSNNNISDTGSTHNLFEDLDSIFLDDLF